MRHHARHARINSAAGRAPRPRSAAPQETDRAWRWTCVDDVEVGLHLCNPRAGLQGMKQSLHQFSLLASQIGPEAWCRIGATHVRMTWDDRTTLDVQRDVRKKAGNNVGYGLIRSQYVQVLSPSLQNVRPDLKHEASIWKSVDFQIDWSLTDFFTPRGPVPPVTLRFPVPPRFAASSSRAGPVLGEPKAKALRSSKLGGSDLWRPWSLDPVLLGVSC